MANIHRSIQIESRNDSSKHLCFHCIVYTLHDSEEEMEREREREKKKKGKECRPGKWNFPENTNLGVISPLLFEHLVKKKKQKKYTFFLVICRCLFFFFFLFLLLYTSPTQITDTTNSMVDTSVTTTPPTFILSSSTVEDKEKSLTPSAMLATYLKSRRDIIIDPTSSVHQLQETWRVRDAGSARTHPDRTMRGWCALASIREWISRVSPVTSHTVSASLSSSSTVVSTLISDATLDATLDSTLVPLFEYARRLSDEVGHDEKKRPNVRAEVVAIWTWPRSVDLYPLRKRAYIPWTPCDVPHDLLDVCLSRVHGELRLVDGKVYYHIEGGLCTTAWGTSLHRGIDLARVIPGVILVPNPESSHVTLVQSDVVAAMGWDTITWESCLKRANTCLAERRDCIVGRGLHHTASLDYAPFAVVVVASIQIELLLAINTALQEIQQRSLEKVGRVALTLDHHVTLAVLLR